ARILRLFVNVHTDDPRVWVTSDTFPRLFERFGRRAGWPVPAAEGIGRRLLRLFEPRPAARGPYDQFMLRLHNVLKSNERFQERGPRRYWKFPPGSLWLAFTDGVSHAVLRGRYALEHSFFVPLGCLELPGEAPAAILDRACRAAGETRAA